MNTIMKTAIGAVMLGGAALAGTAPANAAVVGVTLGVPGVAFGYYGNECYGPLAWRPAYCFAPVYGAPVYYTTGWYAPYRFGRQIVVRDVVRRPAVQDHVAFRGRDIR